MTPEQAVYSAAFTQALAASCGLHQMNTGGYHDPNYNDIAQAKAWAVIAVKAWHEAHTEPGFERF